MLIPRTRLVVALCFSFVVGACGEAAPPVDAAGTDGGARADGGSDDAGDAIDAGTLDAAPVDAGDGGAGDAGAADGGATPPCTLGWTASTTGGAHAAPAFTSGAAPQAYWVGSDFGVRSADVGTSLVDRSIGALSQGLARGVPLGVAVRGDATYLALDLPEVGVAVLAADGTIAHPAHVLAADNARRQFLVDTPAGVAQVWFSTSGTSTRIASLDEDGEASGTIATLALTAIDAVVWDGTALVLAHRVGERAVLTRVALDGSVLGSVTVPGTSRITGTALLQRADGTFLVAASTLYRIALSVVQADLSAATAWTFVVELEGVSEWVTLAGAGTGSDALLAWSDTDFSSSVADVTVAVVRGTEVSAPWVAGAGQQMASQYGSVVTARGIGAGDWVVGWSVVSPSGGRVARLSCAP